VNAFVTSVRGSTGRAYLNCIQLNDVDYNLNFEITAKDNSPSPTSYSAYLYNIDTNQVRNFIENSSFYSQYKSQLNIKID
jgi:hypothetical protein